MSQGAPSPHSFLPPKVFRPLGCLDVADKDSQRCVWAPVCPRRSSRAEIPSGPQGRVDFRPRAWRLSGVTLPFTERWLTAALRVLFCYWAQVPDSRILLVLFLVASVCCGLLPWGLQEVFFQSERRLLGERG